MSSGSIRAALIANATVAGAKTVGAFFTGSASMAAEAVHSFADCGNQLLLMWGQKSSQRKPDIQHPFGYGMNAYFWAFVVALVLFSLGGVYSIYEGVHKVLNPEPVKYALLAMGILMLGFVMELRSFMVCVKEIKATYPGKSMKWFFKETRDSTLLVIFGEDAAALLGLGIAGSFLGLTVLTGNPIWDAIGSVAVGVLLCGVAFGLFVETKALLIGQSVDPTDRQDLRDFLSEHNCIEHVYDLKTLTIGHDEALLLIRARFSEKEDAAKLLDDIDHLEFSINEKFPQFKKIYVEPDNKHEDY